MSRNSGRVSIIKFSWLHLANVRVRVNFSERLVLSLSFFLALSVSNPLASSLVAIQSVRWEDIVDTGRNKVGEKPSARATGVNSIPAR